MSSNEVVNRQSVTSPNAECVLIAIDISGSMDDYDASLGMKRIVSARDAYMALLEITDYTLTNYALSFWNTDADIHIVLTRDSLALMNADFPKPYGGTNICTPICLGLDEKVNRMILLSDGRAQDKNRVPGLLEDVISAGIKIDTIGIGDHDIDLMKMIAEATGGFYSAPKNYEDLMNSFQMLETKNRLLLEHHG